MEEEKDRIEAEKAREGEAAERESSRYQAGLRRIREAILGGGRYGGRMSCWRIDSSDATTEISRYDFQLGNTRSCDRELRSWHFYVQNWSRESSKDGVYS